MLGLPGALNVDGLQPSPPSFPRTWLPQSLGQAQENRGQHFPHCLRPPSGEQAGLAAFPSPPAFTQAPSCHFWFCKHWSLFLSSWPGPLALLPSLAKFLVILQVFVLDVSSSRKTREDAVTIGKKTPVVLDVQIRNRSRRTRQDDV